MRKMRKIVVAAAVALLFAPQALAKDYNLQSAFPKNFPVLSESADYFVKRLSDVTGGAINFKHLGAGELSPPFEVLNNVGSGAIDAGWSYAGYAAGKAPAAELFGSIPFGPDAAKYLAWIHHGGGLELWREIYAPFNVVPMPCGAIISEAGGWFRKPINSPADLKGLKMRIAGLGGKILAKAGANPQSIPAGEIYTSLDTGRLDATELSFPLIDQASGLYKIAKNYYFPGWHQPSGLIEFYVNTKVWESWTSAQRTAVDMACQNTSLWAIGKASIAQQAPLEEFRKNGVKVGRFPDSVIATLRKAADEVYAESSAKDPMFKKVLDSYREFSRKYEEYQQLNK